MPTEIILDTSDFDRDRIRWFVEDKSTTGRYWEYDPTNGETLTMIHGAYSAPSCDIKRMNQLVFEKQWKEVFNLPSQAH